RAARRARGRRNRARAPPANGSAGSSSRLLLLVRELAIAPERAGQMAPHGVARALRVAGGDGVVDATVLFLDQREIGALPAHALGQPAHRAPRYQVAADELQEARELGIAGRLRDGAVQRDVLLDRTALVGDRLVERVQRRGDGAHLRLARALGGKTR